MGFPWGFPWDSTPGRWVLAGLWPRPGCSERRWSLGGQRWQEHCWGEESVMLVMLWWLLLVDEAWDWLIWLVWDLSHAKISCRNHGCRWTFRVPPAWVWGVKISPVPTWAKLWWNIMATQTVGCKWKDVLTWPLGDSLLFMDWDQQKPQSRNRPWNCAFLASTLPFLC